MGRQSSRIYFNGKDHKDIYFNGKLHNAMYFKDQGGIIWQKLRGGSGGIVSSVLNTISENFVTSMGINALYPVTRELDATYVAKPQSDVVFNTIVRGKNVAFAYNNLSDNKLSFVWLTDSGTYWKKISVNKSVKWVIPCYDGFVYLDYEKNLHKVVLSNSNDFVSDKIIYENFKELGTGAKPNSYNGVWKYNYYDMKVEFVTHNGLVAEYQFDERGENLSIRQCFVNNFINYAYITGSFYSEEIGSSSPRVYVLSCNGEMINVEIDSGVYVSNPNSWIRDVHYIVPWNGKFYLFYEAAATPKTIKSLTSFSSAPTLLEEWGENDYIDVDLIGGECYGIDTIRVYMAYYRTAQTDAYASRSDNVLSVYFRNTSPTTDIATFSGGIVVDNGALYKVGWGNAELELYFDSPIITKQSRGFAYFTNNIGVGVSYP